MLELARNGPCEILHDRPTRVRAELEATREVEFLDRSQQRHISIAHQFKEVLIWRNVPLRDRYHESQIGPRDFVLRRHGLLMQRFDLVHQARLRLCRV